MTLLRILVDGCLFESLISVLSGVRPEIDPRSLVTMRIPNEKNARSLLRPLKGPGSLPPHPRLLRGKGFLSFCLRFLLSQSSDIEEVQRVLLS